MGTPYYSSKGTTKTASLISSSGGSSSPSKTSSTSSTSKPKTSGYTPPSTIKSTEVHETRDDSGKTVSVEVTKATDGVITSQSKYGVETVRIVRGGVGGSQEVTKATNGRITMQAKEGEEKISIIKGEPQKRELKRAKSLYPSELESFLAQAGPSPDHPAYISSQRFLAPGTNLPIFVSDINLPEGEGVKGQGRRLIEQRLEEAYGLTRGYEYADVQLDTDPELERIFYPVGLFPKGAKITGSSIEKIRIERPSIEDLSKTLTSAELEYEIKRRKEEPGINEYIQSMNINLEVPSTAFASEQSEFITISKNKVSPFFEPLPSNFPIETQYLYYTEDFPGYKGRGVFATSTSPAATPEISQIVGIKQDWLPGMFDVNFLRQPTLKGWVADADEPKIILSSLTGEYKFTKDELKGIYYASRRAPLLGLAVGMNLPDEKTGLTPKQEALIPKDTFTKNLAAWDVWVEKNPLLGGVSFVGRFTSEGIKKQFGFKGNQIQDLPVGYVSGGLETVMSVGEFGGKVVNRAIVPFYTAYETGDVGKTAGEVWRSYSTYPAVFLASLGEIGLIGYKDPMAAGVIGSYVLGSAATLKIAGEGVAMGVSYIKEQISKPKFSVAKAEHFVTEVNYKDMSARGLSKAETYTEIGSVKVKGEFGGSMYLKEVEEPLLFSTEDLAMQAKGAIIEAGAYKMVITRPKFFGLLGTETKVITQPIVSNSLISPTYTAPDVIGGFEYNTVITSAKFGNQYYTSYNIGRTVLEVDTKMRVTGWSINRPVDWKQELPEGWTTHISFTKGGDPSHLWTFKEDIPVFKQTNVFAGETGTYMTYELSSVYNPFSKVIKTSLLDKPLIKEIPSPYSIQETPKYDIQGTLFKSKPVPKYSGWVSVEEITGAGQGTVQVGKLVMFSKIKGTSIGSTLTQTSVDTAIEYSSTQFGKEIQSMFNALNPPRPPGTKTIQISIPKTTTKQVSLQPIIQVAGQITPQKTVSVQKESVISKELYKMNTILQPVSLMATENISLMKQPAATKQISLMKQRTPDLTKQITPQVSKVISLTKMITPALSITMQKRPPSNITLKFNAPQPPPPTFLIPKIPLIAGDESYYKRYKGKKQKKPAIYAGTPPSFTAIIGNIRGGKVSKKSLISGIGIRPITKGWFGKGRRII